MKLLHRILVATYIASMPIGAAALEVGESDFVWVSDLAIAGFKPFPVSSSGKASFGMMQDTDMYLCFLADNEKNQATRRDVLIASLQDDNASRTLPNIPVACILAQ